MIYISVCIGGIVAYFILHFLLNLFFVYFPPDISEKDKTKLSWQLTIIIVLVTFLTAINIGL